jgi:hypothetical protein
MATLHVCKSIRKVGGGYIVEVRWPYGPDVMGHGEVVCKTWDEAVDLLTRAANEDAAKGESE